MDFLIGLGGGGPVSDLLSYCRIVARLKYA